MESRVPLQRVHFFEMVAQDMFTRYLRSALVYISNVLFEKIAFLVPFRYRKGLILSIVELLIEYNYLRKHEATYSEYYYGIKRVSQNHNLDPTMTRLGSLKTLIVASLIPILKLHLDNYFTSLKMNANAENTGRMKKIFLKIYPFVNMAWESINFVYSIKYLLDPKSKFYSVLYHILKQEVTKIDEENLENQTRSSMLMDMWKKYFVFFIYLATKFIEWYFDSDRRRNEIIKSNENISVDPPFKEEDNSQTLKNICPICNKKISFPSCLDVCGYVFCQACIIDYVKRHYRCPITHLPCDINNIHKIYDE